MRFGKDTPRPSAARRREAYRPRVRLLEQRILLAIDLGGSSPPNLPLIATFPYGIDLAGGQSNGGVGFSVSDVGDVNGDGFDDFLLGAPTVINNGGQITVGTGGNSRAYLIFGSRQVNAGNVDWLTLQALENSQGLQNGELRVGDLAQLGNSALGQQNPITGQQGFPFDGITFLTSQNNRSQLGASVAEVGTVNGAPAFLIGAPGANDSTGTTSFSGRAYLVYGGASLNNLVNKTIDLDNPAGNQGVTFVTFVINSSAGTARLGASVAGVGDLFSEGTNDIAIGAPNATFNGNANAGEVFVISGLALPATNQVINVGTVGQTGGTRGLLFGGASSGANAGFSVADAGSTTGALTTFNSRIPDLLIGSPGINTAYLVYGGGGLLRSASNFGGIAAISLGAIGDPNATPGAVAGAAFVGNAGDGTGYAVSSAGDFNDDGFGDILIGSPFATINGNANTGRVDLIFGQPASGTTILGNIPLNAIPTTILSASFTGDGAGALAGYSVSAVGRISPTSLANPILIGSPGFNSNQGAVYVIPGNVELQGTFTLTNAAAQPVAATVFTFTDPALAAPPFFGASVEGRITQQGQTHTGDSDLIADFIVGAPGYGVITGRGLDGGAMILEGAFVPLQTPVSTAINVTIGVGTAFGPFTVNATTPNALQIFVFSDAATGFNPVTDLDPTTIVVNGVAFPTATIAADPVDENRDGIPDAIVTITPRSNLGLLNTTTSLTFRARTLAASAIPNRLVLGSATITVTGGGGGGGGGGGTGNGGAAPPIGLVIPTTFTPQFGDDRFVPAPSTLSTFTYKPIPWRYAYRQFQPAKEFEQRTLNYFYPNKFHFQPRRTGKGNEAKGTFTLGQHTFDRGIYHAGKKIEFTHKGAVIPTNLQTERLSPTKPLGGKLP